MKKVLVPLLMAVVIAIYIMLDAGSSVLIIFWNAPDLLLILITVLLISIISGTIGDMFKGVKIAFSKNLLANDNIELRLCSNAMSVASKQVYFALVIGIICRMIFILPMLEIQDNIFVYIAPTLVLVFYAMLINLFLYGIKANIEREIIIRKKSK